MDLIQQGIITLLKSAVVQEPLALPDGFDMEAAYPLITRHHMATMCFDGAVRCGISRREPVMQKLFRDYCRALQISEGQMGELGRVFAAFEEQGIDYMPVKGSNMKALYPRPELRTMGDADVLIRMDQYDRIVPIMEDLGFMPVLESDHELIWRSPALYLELHKHLIPSYNRDYYAYFGDGWELAKVRRGCRFSMTAEDTYIYLLTHFAKHYRDGGIGCRHVVDLWIYRRANPELDEAYIAAELEKLGLRTFHGHICRLLEVWFSTAAADPRVEVLTACVFSSGSWGTRENSLLSQVIKESRHSPVSFSVRLVYLWCLLFPRIDDMRRAYPVLKRAPWLLPVMWLIRPVHKLLFRGRKLKKYRQNLEELSRKKLDDRHQMLRYVGLDYNF